MRRSATLVYLEHTIRGLKATATIMASLCEAEVSSTGIQKLICARRIYLPNGGLILEERTPYMEPPYSSIFYG